MEIITNSPGFLHIFKKILRFSDYPFIKSNGKLLKNSNRNLRLVCKNWKRMIENEEFCVLTHLLKRNKLKFNSHFDLIDFLHLATFNLLRKDMVEQLHINFPHLVEELSYDYIIHITFIILKSKTPNQDELSPHIKQIFLKILQYFLECDTKKRFLVIEPCNDKNGSQNFKSLDSTWISDHMKGAKQNALILALSYDWHNDQVDLINAFIEHLQKVKYPEQISKSVLTKINELATQKCNLEINSIIAEKVGIEDYALMSLEIMKKWSDLSIDGKAVKFMTSRIQISENENLQEIFYDYLDEFQIDSNIREAIKDITFEFDTDEE